MQNEHDSAWNDGNDNGFQNMSSSKGASAKFNYLD